MWPKKLSIKNRGGTAENFALLDKIHKFLRIIYSLATFSLNYNKTPWGDGFKFGNVL